MSEVSMIGLDIAKQVFQVHGTDSKGLRIFSRRIARRKVLEFFADQPPCLVALEACGGAHHWARELARLNYGASLLIKTERLRWSAMVTSWVRSARMEPHGMRCGDRRHRGGR